MSDHQWVPKEPTEAMLLRAGEWLAESEYGPLDPTDLASLYSILIAAAPPSPAPTGVEETNGLVSTKDGWFFADEDGNPIGKRFATWKEANAAWEARVAAPPAADIEETAKAIVVTEIYQKHGQYTEMGTAVEKRIATALRAERERGKAADETARAYEASMRAACDSRDQWRARADAAEAQVASLRVALEPFANAVFNDNGDMTVDLAFAKYDDYVRAYFANRRAALATKEPT